ncbi:MAG TPA: NUDIX hydrolase [Flavitalea sp.]|nr:NUDIX hydrolase [Flavitalea sp.]
MDQNPWKILSSREAYDNSWIKVTEYGVINPSGGRGIYGKVQFKNLAIGVIVLDNSLNTYLVGQYRFPIDKFSWEIPEGGCPMNMLPLEGAKKELLEETGLKANMWEIILEMDLSNSVTDEHAIVFLAYDLEQHKPAPEETEQIEIRKLPFDDAYMMVEDGIITDSISVAAIMKVKLMLADGRIT